MSYSKKALYRKSKFFSIALLLLAFGCSSSPKPELETVNSVDLSRYRGTWYEIAKIPNPFQKSCLSDTTATYELLEGNTVKVVNRCLTSNKTPIEATGTARVTSLSSNAKLEVSFVSILGLQLFWGDYWIIGLDEGYRYAVVGDPDRTYGWILARTPSLENDLLQNAFGTLSKNGYNTKDFKFTKHHFPKDL